MAACECTACATSLRARLSYSATPVSSQEVSMPRISMGHSDTICAPFRTREVERDANSTREGKRAVRGGDAPLQAHRGKNRPADRAPLPRVLREAHRRTQAQACRRREAPPQAPAQPDAAAEAVLASL